MMILKSQTWKNPTFELYEYDDGDGYMPDSPDEQLEDTPEVSDYYINTEVMLPRGGSMDRVKVVIRRQDCDGNTTGRAN